MPSPSHSYFLKDGNRRLAQMGRETAMLTRAMELIPIYASDDTTSASASKTVALTGLLATDHVYPVPKSGTASVVSVAVSANQFIVTFSASATTPFNYLVFRPTRPS